MMLSKDLYKFCPIAASFKNVQDSLSVMQELTEYKTRFKKIIEENSNFSVQLLDMCRSQKEADLVLSETRIDELRREGMYPILSVAMDCENIKFVAHDFCQQVLRDTCVTSDDGQVRGAVVVL